MDAVSGVVMTQALLQQTMALAAIKQAEAMPQAAQLLAGGTPAPEGNAPSVPAGSNGRVVDIFA
jgi:hypothetical protein